MSRKVSASIILLIVLMSLTILSVQGFHHPSSTDDLLYEQWGPRPKEVLMKIYGSYASEYLAFKAQEIDVMDWPLAAGDYAELETFDPTHAKYSAVGYKSFDLWELDINNQQYPTDMLSVRRALSHLVDKDYFINYYVGATVAVKADSPTAHLPAWYNPYCTDLYNLAPRVVSNPISDLPDYLAAYNYLVSDLGSAVPDPEGGGYYTWLWPAKPTDPHGYVNLANHLLVFARSDDPNRASLGAFIKTALEVDFSAACVALGLPPCRIHCDLYTVPRAECRREVLCEYRYHVYTGDWGFTRDPDNLAFCYASYQCWKPTCYSPNYVCYANPLFDAAWDNAEMSSTPADVVPHVYQCQQIMMDDAAIIPVWLTAGYKAYLSKWDNVVNMAGRGPHNFWTLLNSYIHGGAGYGDTLRYGFMNDIAFLNPVHASWVWDWYVTENIYDTLTRFNPYDAAEDIPWMASWEIGTWDGGTKTSITFHLRDGIYWQDVPPKADRKYGILPGGATKVPVTTKDVAFTIITIRDNIDARNQFLVADVAKVEMNDIVLGGAQMVRSYDGVPMDVYGLPTVPESDIIVYYNILSPWLTLHWVGGLPIMPFHIWYWVPWWDYDGDGTIDTWLYDLESEDTLYGCGPYIFDYRIPGIEILLKAFKEGTAYHGITSTSQYMKAFTHDMAITDVKSSKTVVGQGYSADINVTVANQGSFTETFNVTLYASSGLETGLVGYWKLDEGSGTTAFDSSGNKNHGSLFNGPTWVDGKIGRALSFDGVDDYVEVPDDASLDFSYSSFSVAAWSRRFGTDDWQTSVIATGGSFWTQGFLLQHRNGFWAEVSDGIGDGVYIQAFDLGLYDGNWHHLVLVVDRSSNAAYGYVDGIKVVGPIDISGEGDLHRDNTPIRIGRLGLYSPEPQYFNGKLDEVKIYNRTLSAAEIWSEYIRALSAIQTRTVTLESGVSTTLTFQWNTAGFAKGNYTLSAYAWPVLGETDTTDNNMIDGWIIIAMAGDITGTTPCVPDGIVDVFDLVACATHFGHLPPNDHTTDTLQNRIQYNMCFKADIDGNGIVDIFDIVIIGIRYGQIDP